MSAQSYIPPRAATVEYDRVGLETQRRIIHMAKKRARGVVKSAGRGGSTQVMAKVQGEGDYASARRYNSETRKFVKAKGAAATRAPGGGVDRAALRKARSKARDDGTEDRRDAKLMSQAAKRRKPAARRGSH
jgi:hypothetical protein